VPVVTSLRETRGGKVAVDLDGARWRTLPPEVVVRVRLGVGEELDRVRLRELARELRRARALDAGLRALSRRDLSSAALQRRLERRRVRPAERDEALGVLERAGLVDDERYAVRRAESLAARGQGDAAIRWRLGRDGVSDDLAAAAVERLEPERDRAARIVASRGAGHATARELARRGFGEDAVESALGPAVADEA
jgi:SOS response regulatory protein OraA/RecX